MDPVTELHDSDMDPLDWAQVNGVEVRKRPDFKNIWHRAIWYLVLCVNPFIRDKWIVIGETVYAHPQSRTSSPEFNRLLVHECTHVFQWRDKGKYKYLLDYFILKFPVLWSNRTELEVEAYANQLIRKVIKGDAHFNDIEKYRDLICGPDYGYPTLDREGVFKFLFRCYRQAQMGYARSVYEVTVPLNGVETKYASTRRFS